MMAWGVSALFNMAGLQLSGLASNFDWKSLVDQLSELERAPVTRLETEKRSNTLRSSALSDLGTKLEALRTASSALSGVGVFSARKTSSSASSGAWTSSAEVGSAIGSYEINVTQLAKPARRLGQGDIAGPMHNSSDVSSLTMATLRTGAAVTGGIFSINGQRVTISTADSLQDVFDAISNATGGDVVGSYDPLTDKVTLASASNSTITLGAANDTSNFLRVMKLANNGSDEISSSATLGTLKLNATLGSSGLRGSITNVDAQGAGTFKINGVEIAFNATRDSLSTIMKRINASDAGVNAAYDSVNDRVVLTSNLAGDTGLSLSETGSGLLNALGLTSGATVERGADTVFTINNGDPLTNAGTVLDEAAHGITGLNVNATSLGTQTITVEADTTGMRSKIDAFISAYNAVQTFIDDKTKITSSDGKVSAALLSNNREVQEWSRELREAAFGAASGVSGTLKRLDDLGIGFTGVSGQLAVRDESKLTTALRDRPTEVESLFQTGTTGFAAKFETILGRIITSNSAQQTRFTKTNSSIDRQISDLERRLTQKREMLTDTFIRMEEAQAKLNQQSSALTRAFSSSSSS